MNRVQTQAEQETRVPQVIRLCAALTFGSLLSGACSASTAPSNTTEQAEATSSPVGESVPGILTTIAGNGFAASDGDGGPATEASLEYPNVLGFDQEGNLYVSDGATRVRRIDPSGTITTVVGPPAGGETAAAGQAGSVLGRGKGIDADGNLYVATSVKGGDEQSMLVKITPSGDVTTLAGTGHSGFSGDGGPGADARLSSVYGRVAVDADGNVFFADFDNNRVRMVATSGIITTVVGTGEAGLSGDGGPARHARIYHPTCVSLDPQGNLFVAEGEEHHRIRMMNKEGMITTVVRNGRLIGGTGTAADELLSGYVWADDAGNLYLVDEARPRVFLVDANGTATAIAGTGRPGYSGDGGPATQAQLNEPIMAIVGRDGVVYIADAGNNLIRKVEPSGE
jgi:hypothetical protein